MNPIDALFEEFIKDSVKKSQDIEYCLLQSCVEPIIRFKFGAWLHENYAERISINLMETNRIDLVIGIDDNVFLIEFGHLLNLLQHGALLNKRKIESDSSKIEEKSVKLIEKIKRIDKFEGKNIHLVICSLFSDIKLHRAGEFYETRTKLSRIKSGTLFKYGNKFQAQKENKYFENYSNHSKLRYNNEEALYLTGFKEVEIIKDQISLHYKFEIIDKKSSIDEKVLIRQISY
jgi:hypothetical protein